MNAEEFYNPKPKTETRLLIDEIQHVESFILKANENEKAIKKQIALLETSLKQNKDAKNKLRQRRFMLTAKLAFMEGL
jgi:hypothetical protein